MKLIHCSGSEGWTQTNICTLSLKCWKLKQKIVHMTWSAAFNYSDIENFCEGSLWNILNNNIKFIYCGTWVYSANMLLFLFFLMIYCTLIVQYLTVAVIWKVFFFWLSFKWLSTIRYIFFVLFVNIWKSRKINKQVHSNFACLLYFYTLIYIQAHDMGMIN